MWACADRHMDRNTHGQTHGQPPWKHNTPTTNLWHGYRIPATNIWLGINTTTILKHADINLHDCLIRVCNHLPTVSCNRNSYSIQILGHIGYWCDLIQNIYDTRMVSSILTLKVPITTAADDIYKYFFIGFFFCFFFRENKTWCFM